MVSFPVRDEQPLKADFPIDVKLSDKFTETNFEQD
jgi:hypothetical protein